MARKKVTQTAPKAEHWSDDANLLYDYADVLEKQHSQRLALDKACLRLLCPRPDLNAVQRNNRGDIVAVAAYEQFRRQGQNLSREITGSALAMTCQPMQVKVMPVGADAKLRQFCKQATQLTDGVFMANRFNELHQRISEDSMWATVGACKVYVDPVTSEIRIARVDPLGFFWDIYEGEEPLTLIEVHAVPRRRLMAEYPEHAHTIKSLTSWYPAPIPGVDYYGVSGAAKPDTVRVVEGWAVKMGDKVGKHAICVKGAVLTPEDEQAYDDTDHDICVLRWDNDPRGFGGYSLLRGVAPFHAQIARYQRMRMEQLKACIPVIWVNDEEETFKNISDLEYQIARYSGDKPPVIAVAGAVSGDLTAEIESLRERCYQQHGVNFQVSTGQKPAGLNSAPAQREWLDTANLRLQTVQQRREQLWKDVANRITRKASVAYKSKAARVRAPGTDFLSEIKWPNLKEDQYQAAASVASGLSLTISGKLDQLEVLTNLRVIDPEDVGQHVKLPDTETLQEQKSAPSDLASKQIDDNLEGNVKDDNGNPLFVSPSPHQDIPRALRLARLNYQLALKRGIYDTDAIQRLRRYIRKCEAMMPALPPPPAPGAPPPGAPPIVPPV